MSADKTPPGRIPLGVILWALLAVAALAAFAWAANMGLFSWETARRVRSAADEFVANYTLVAYAGYVALFVVLALLLFPAQLWIIVFGAILFGFWPALIVSWLAAVLSAVSVFIAARGALADRYRNRAGKYLARVEEGFRRDQFSWMLAMRFIPIVPFFVSNVAPAFLGARLAPFIAAAAVGVIPYMAVYTFAGDRARDVLDVETPPDLASLAADLLPIMLAFAALPLLALLVRRLLSRSRKP